MTNRARRLAVAATLVVGLLVPAGAAGARGGNGGGSGQGHGRSSEARGVPDDPAQATSTTVAGDDQDEQGERDDQGNGGRGGRPDTPPGQVGRGEGRGNRPAEAGADPSAPRAVPPGWARAAERAATRPATLTGTVAAAGSGSITVSVKGGHPLFRLWARQQATADVPATVTVTLAEGGVVKLDGTVATLADLAAGDHVSARGTFADGTLTAARVNASSPDDDGTESD